MSHPSDGESNSLVNGIMPRLPESDRDTELQQQLYRYAEDLQQMIERNDKLKANYQSLLASSNQLLESLEELNNLMQITRDIYLVTDQEGVIHQVNPASIAIAPREKLIHANLKDWIVPAHFRQYLSMLNAAQIGIEGRMGGESELHLRSLNAKTGVMITAAQVLRTANEDNPFFQWIIRDITHVRESEFENKISTVVLQNAGEGVIITDAEGDICAVNPAFTRITGFSAAESIGRNPRFLQSGMQSKHFYEGMWRALEQDGTWQGMIHNRTKAGRNYPQWLCINSIKNDAGAVLSYIGVFSDLSALQQADNDLAHLAYYDTLTGLPNRQLLHDRLRQVLSQARRSRVCFSVIYIDLDGFKEINDTYGHDLGDFVLQEVARRMSASVREIDTVARLGGDEFIVLSPLSFGEAGISKLCEKLLDVLGQPMNQQGHELILGASLGCAEYPEHGVDEISLIKHADIAMYQAKKSGGNRFKIFDCSLIN
jgi:diguanylate cyclase (GGDEF)-like protein/PAS domain S-box-containing protein